MQETLTRSRIVNNIGIASRCVLVLEDSKLQECWYSSHDGMKSAMVHCLAIKEEERSNSAIKQAWYTFSMP